MRDKETEMAARGMKAVRRRDLNALARFVRRQEAILRYSYNSPGKNDWEEAYKKADPRGWKLFDAARQAVRRSIGTR